MQFFIGITPSDEMQEKIISFQRSFANNGVPDSVEPYITVKSQGGLTEDKAWLTRIGDIAKNTKSFQQAFEGAGSFGDNVIFLKPVVSKELINLHKALFNATGSYEDPTNKYFEGDRYHPHMTLGGMKWGLTKEEAENMKERAQKEFGHPDYRAIYGTGCITRPDVCLILMNPTARNVSVHKDWKGLRASWLGTKNIWKLLYQLNLLDEKVFTATQNKKPQDWNDKFARSLYAELAKKKVFLTNLARSTQPDARPISNSVFAACVPLMEEEIRFIKPKVVITFGNQVSSALLKRPIKVSESRKKSFGIKTKDFDYTVYATYYPVGMGIMNMGKAVEDIKWILSKHATRKRSK